MKSKLQLLFIALALMFDLQPAGAQSPRFFRISGPSATTITSFSSSGVLAWSNAQPGETYTIQTATSLGGQSNWVDYVQIPTTASVNTNLIVDPNPPAGMSLIPAGSFTMGGNQDGETDAAPVSVTVSGFYMDINLVSFEQWQAVYMWATNHGYGNMNPGSAKAAGHPIQTAGQTHLNP